MHTFVDDRSPAVQAQACAERYEVLEAIGSGGTACVFRARDRETGEVVALKTLHASCAAHPVTSARFAREAELASRVRHANVAVVHGLVEQGGTRYLVMEYVEGRTLGSVLSSGNRLPLDVALGLFRQICEGVQAAHDEGVIHRDLKPDNVLVARRDGRAVILDFGIARTLAADTLTQEGVLIGSLHYMAPEQLSGGEVTTRTDVYSLAVILYELVTGTCPFRAPDLTLAQCVSLRMNVPKPGARVPDLPDRIATALEIGLSLDPRDRFQTPREMWDHVADALSPTEAKGLKLFVEGRAVVIGRAPEAMVAMAPGRAREEVVDRLQRLGCTVVIAASGPDALQSSFARGCQLLVMGEGLPGLDPFTACQIMRRFARWDATRALVLVDGRDPVRVTQARESGASDVATLPLQIHAFARQARRLLQDGG